MATQSIPEVTLIGSRDRRLARLDWPSSDRVGYEQTLGDGDGPFFVVVPPGATDESLQKAAHRFAIPLADLTAMRAKERETTHE